MFSPIRKKITKIKEKKCRKGHGLLNSFRDLSILDLKLENENIFHSSKSTADMCNKRSNTNRRCDDGSLGDYSILSDSCDSNFSSDDDAYFWEIFVSSDASPSKTRKSPKMSTPSSNRKQKEKSQTVIPLYFTPTSSLNNTSKSLSKKRPISALTEKMDSVKTRHSKNRSPDRSPVKIRKKNIRNVSFHLKYSGDNSADTSLSISRNRSPKKASLNFSPSPRRRRSRSPIVSSSEKNKTATRFTPNPQSEHFVPTMKDSGTVLSNSIVDTITTSKIHEVRIAGIPNNVSLSTPIKKRSILRKALTEPKLKRKIESPRKIYGTAPKKQCHGIDRLVSRSSISFDIKPLEKSDKEEKSILKKQCTSCKCTVTSVWRDTVDGTPLCNECGLLWRVNRVCCHACWYIPKHTHKSQFQCPNCFAFNESTQSNRRFRKFVSSLL